MNRRDLFKTLGALLPVGTVVQLEPTVQRGDLVVIQPAHLFTLEEARNMELSVASLWPNDAERPRILALEPGCRLHVERGIAAVEVPVEAKFDEDVLLDRLMRRMAQNSRGAAAQMRHALKTFG